jgi:hypothetical protein
MSLNEDKEAIKSVFMDYETYKEAMQALDPKIKNETIDSDYSKIITSIVKDFANVQAAIKNIKEQKVITGYDVQNLYAGSVVYANKVKMFFYAGSKKYCLTVDYISRYKMKWFLGPGHLKVEEIQ